MIMRYSHAERQLHLNAWQQSGLTTESRVGSTSCYPTSKTAYANLITLF